jgi:hypothetical protein
MRLFLSWLVGVPVVVAIWLLLKTMLFSSEEDRHFLDSLRASQGAVIDLSREMPGDWERVCILGPYSGDEAAAKALGFDWKVDAHSSIRSSDTISLMVLVKGGEVTRDIDVPRRDGDFSGLSGQCFTRASAKFTMKQQSQGGWPIAVSALTDAP